MTARPHNPTDGKLPSRSGENDTPAERRLGARLIVQDSDGLVLLLQGRDPGRPEVLFWVTPGGGVDPGESYEEAAARELLEEAGLEISRLGGVVREEEVEFVFEGVRFLQRQRYFAVQVPVSGTEHELDRRGWTDFERRSITAQRWWSLDELDETAESVYPPDLARLVRSATSWGEARFQPP